MTVIFCSYIGSIEFYRRANCRIVQVVCKFAYRFVVHNRKNIKSNPRNCSTRPSASTVFVLDFCAFVREAITARIYCDIFVHQTRYFVFDFWSRKLFNDTCCFESSIETLLMLLSNGLRWFICITLFRVD